MLEVELAYMDDTLKIDFPDSITVDRYKPSSKGDNMDYESFKEAFLFSDTSAFLDAKNPLIVVNDAHRSTPTPLLLQWLKKLDHKQFNLTTFLVACGTHKKPNDKEYYTIFGDLYQEIKGSVYAHDCHNSGELQSIGFDSFGEEVYLNKKIFEHDKVWIINSVEPHYFAGFTGGRKSLVPGLADFKTIERNHNLANSLDCSPLKLQGNPLAEHLESILELVDQKNISSMQVVSDTEMKIAHLAFGSLKESFEEAVAVSTEIYSTTCSVAYDLLLLEILPPLDRSIYQAQKALENCQSLVKDNGSIIVCSGCADGIGSDYFYQLAENWDSENNCPKDGKLSFGSHKLKRVIDIGRRINVYLKSSLSDEIVSKLFYKPIDNISTYIQELTECNKELKIGVVQDAAHLVLKNK